MFRDKGFRKSSPLTEGQELDVTIEAVGEKGDGIAKSKGFVIFVPGVKQGDNVKVRITKVLRNFSFGEAIGPASGSGESDAPAAKGKKRRTSEESEESSEGSKEESSDKDSDEFGGDDDNSGDNNEDDNSNEEF